MFIHHETIASNLGSWTNLFALFENRWMSVAEKMFRNYIEFKVIETLGGGREQPIVKQER